jgi:L-iditol 2-dehydrogenase
VRVAPFNPREGLCDETLIDVAAVGICGSNLRYYKDGGIGSAIIHDPFIPGHEFGSRLIEDIPEGFIHPSYNATSGPPRRL